MTQSTALHYYPMHNSPLIIDMPTLTFGRYFNFTFSSFRPRSRHIFFVCLLFSWQFFFRKNILDILRKYVYKYIHFISIKIGFCLSIVFDLRPIQLFLLSLSLSHTMYVDCGFMKMSWKKLNVRGGRWYISNGMCFYVEKCQSNGQAHLIRIHNVNWMCPTFVIGS